MNRKTLTTVFAIAVGACQAPETPEPPASGGGPAVPAITAAGETDSSGAGTANDAALLVNGEDPESSLLLASAEAGGLEIYTLDGARHAIGSHRPTTFVDVRYNFPLGGESVDLIVGYDAEVAALIAYVPDDMNTGLREISSPLATQAEINGLCLYQSPISGKFYAFAAGDGEFQQWELYSRDGAVEGRLIRSVPVGLGVAHCVAHDREAEVIFSVETVGVARINAEP